MGRGQVNALLNHGYRYTAVKTGFFQQPFDKHFSPFPVWSAFLYKGGFRVTAFFRAHMGDALHIQHLPPYTFRALWGRFACRAGLFSARVKRTRKKSVAYCVAPNIGQQRFENRRTCCYRVFVLPACLIFKVRAVLLHVSQVHRSRFDVLHVRGLFSKSVPLAPCLTLFSSAVHRRARQPSEVLSPVDSTHYSGCYPICQQFFRKNFPTAPTPFF